MKFERLVRTMTKHYTEIASTSRPSRDAAFVPSSLFTLSAALKMKLTGRDTWPGDFSVVPILTWLIGKYIEPHKTPKPWSVSEIVSARLT